MPSLSDLPSEVLTNIFAALPLQERCAWLYECESVQELLVGLLAAGALCLP